MSVKGSCHCGAFTFEINAAPETVTRCTCTFCSKRGALWAYYAPQDVSMPPPASDAAYRWRSKTVEHHFCPACGCTTYTKTPSWVDNKPDYDHPRIALNARLLDDIDVQAIPETVIDGRNLW
ncbi:MAG: GFA family protein [Asticcacaulis sp.]